MQVIYLAYVIQYFGMISSALKPAVILLVESEPVNWGVIILLSDVIFAARCVRQSVQLWTSVMEKVRSMGLKDISEISPKTRS